MRGVAALAAGIALLGATSTSAGTYTFRNIADQTGPFANFGGAPVINDAGDVAFVASLDDGTQGIFSGPDPGTDTVADDSGPYDTPLDFPSIAADGTVAFRAWLDPTPEDILGGRGLFTGPDPDFDTFADDNGSDFADFDWPSIADDGTIAFGAVMPFGGTAVLDGSDPATDRVADELGPYAFPLFAAAINAEGTVAFFAQLDTGGAGIFTGDDPLNDTVADSSGPYAQFDVPAISDDGTVIFRAVLDSGATGIFRGPDATADRIVGTGGPYAGFSGYSINGEGAVVFGAELDAGWLGLFTGPSPTADKVIAVGDPLFGSTATFVSVLRENLNDNGEVAFLYELADGRSGVAIAAPGALERTIEAGGDYDDVRLTSATGRGTVARLRDGTAGAERTLSLGFTVDDALPIGDVFELEGTGADVVVVELAYDDAGVADEGALRLYWQDPADQRWKDAVLGNAPPGGPDAPGMSFDEYRDLLGAPPQLGAHGNDPDGDTVWAIVNHAGRFAVPEPGDAHGFAAAALALATLAGARLSSRACLDRSATSPR